MFRTATPADLHGVPVTEASLDHLVYTQQLSARTELKMFSYAEGSYSGLVVFFLLF